jgi:hypothetical protein
MHEDLHFKKQAVSVTNGTPLFPSGVTKPVFDALFVSYFLGDGNLLTLGKSFFTVLLGDENWPNLFNSAAQTARKRSLRVCHFSFGLSCLRTMS